MPRKHAPMKRTQHYITQNQIDDLAWLSEETGYGVSEHLRRALDTYFALPHIVSKLRKRPKQLELPLDNPNAAA
jgi:hypothetical protein